MKIAIASVRKTFWLEACLTREHNYDNRYKVMQARCSIWVVVCLILVTVNWHGRLYASDDMDMDTLMQVFDEGGENLPAEADSQSDDILSGFEDESQTNTMAENDSGESDYSVDGYAKFASAYNYAHKAPLADETDWRGVSKLKSELYLELNAKLQSDWRFQFSGKGAYDGIYRIKGYDEYTDDIRDNYETDLILTETWLAGSLTPSLDLKVGRQIVVWGKSDNIRITDVLNPLDLREPGLTDIEDLRLPVFMTRVDCYFGNWNLGGFLIHELRYNQNPEFGSDFYPGDTPLPDQEEPAEGFGETEYALALNGIFSGWDIALYYADIVNDAFRPELDSAFPIPETQLKHDRLDFYGAAINMAWNNWLVKAEAAYWEGFRFFNTEDEIYSRVDLLAGLEYTGFQNMTISLEVANRHVVDFEPQLEDSPDEAIEDDTQSVIRLTGSWLNQSLETTLLAVLYGMSRDEGALQRLSLDYDIDDAWRVRVGVVAYQAGDRPPFEHVEDNDRVVLDLKYSF